MVLCAIWKPSDSTIERAVLPDEVYDGEVDGPEKEGATNSHKIKSKDEKKELTRV